MGQPPFRRHNPVRTSASTQIRHIESNLRPMAGAPRSVVERVGCRGTLATSGGLHRVSDRNREKYHEISYCYRCSLGPWRGHPSSGAGCCRSCSHGPAPTADVAAGAQIFGSDGAAIGTVARVEGDIALVTVGERSIPIPATAIAAGEAGPTVNITRTALVSQFDQQMAQMDAQLEAALVEGAAVQTADGQPLGTIQSREADAIIVAGTAGEMTLSKPMLAIGPEGSLVVRATMAQIQQAMAQASAEG